MTFVCSCALLFLRSLFSGLIHRSLHPPISSLTKTFDHSYHLKLAVQSSISSPLNLSPLLYQLLIHLIVTLKMAKKSYSQSGAGLAGTTQSSKSTRSEQSPSHQSYQRNRSLTCNAGTGYQSSNSSSHYATASSSMYSSRGYSTKPVVHNSGGRTYGASSSSAASEGYWK